MKPGQNPDDIFFCPGQMSPTFRGHRVDDSRRAVRAHLFQDFFVQYGRMRPTSYKERDSGLGDIRHTVLYIDNILRPLISKLLAGHGLAMQVAEHNGNDVKCNYCKGAGHLLQDVPSLRRKDIDMSLNQPQRSN